MKRLVLVLGALIALSAHSPAQIIAKFETGLDGFIVGPSGGGFGSALTGLHQIADPTGKSAGVAKLNFQFAGNQQAKGTLLLLPNVEIPLNGARFITYWVYVPDTIPANYDVAILAQGGAYFVTHRIDIPASSIPARTWFPLSIDLAKNAIQDSIFPVGSGTLFSTGLQIDNSRDTVSSWTDSVYVDNVALVGAQPQVLANFETSADGFADAGFGPALSGFHQAPDPTATSAGVLVTRWNFPADSATKGAIGLKPAGGIPAKNARFVSIWVFLPDTTMPDSLTFDVYAQDNVKYAYHDAATLAKDIPKKVWYPLSLDLAQAAILDPNFNLNSSNIFQAGVQIHSYSYGGHHPAWADSVYLDNLALLYDTIATVQPPVVKQIILNNFNTAGDLGGFSAAGGWAPAFTGVLNAVDTTNAANRVLNVACAFDTGAFFKGAVQKPNVRFFGDTNATDIAIDIFVPPGMPDSARFDLALQGSATNNAWVQDEKILGVDFQKGKWDTLKFSITNHIADASIVDLHGSGTFTVQAYYTSAKKWSGTIMLDNLRLLGIDSLSTTSVAPTGRPYAYRLYQNYPNPFNPSTTIRYELRQQGRVSVKVYNVLGELVATLIDGQETAGPHEAVFDARRLASGVYFYTLRTGGFVKTGKMMLLK